MTIEWDSRKQWLEKLSHKSNVMFALFCAKQVIHLVNNDEAKVAINTVERWLDGKATAEECGAATAAAYHAANAAAYAANAAAAYAAAHAANAAPAADAAPAAAAAYAAADAAAAAAYAATATANAATAANAAAHAATYEVKEQQIEYLRILYIDSLPEEERNCWLVQACL